MGEVILGLHHTRTPDDTHLTAALATYRDHPRLSLADAVVVAHCILRDATPVTFDEALADALPLP